MLRDFIRMRDKVKSQFLEHLDRLCLKDRQRDSRWLLKVWCNRAYVMALRGCVYVHQLHDGGSSEVVPISAAHLIYSQAVCSAASRHQRLENYVRSSMWGHLNAQ